MRLGRHTFADDAMLVMAIVNRTPDSFYDKGATFAEDKAMERVDLVVEQGTDIVDIGGVKAAPGGDVDVAEEIDRVAGLVDAWEVPSLTDVSGPVLLVDALSDTGWTLTMAARELRRAGADAVLPLAVATPK